MRHLILFGFILIQASLASAAPARTAPPRGSVELAAQGSVGVCVRWGADPGHVAEAVVAIPSGNPTLDNAIPATVRTMDWPRTENDRGQWFGVWLAVGNGPRSSMLSNSHPDCSHLPPPPARPAGGTA